MKKLLFTLLTLSFFASSELHADDETPKTITVPFKLLKTGHFIVETKLNGKGPYLLIFDTGAPTMLINNRIANDSGVMKKGTPKPFFAPFGSAGEFKITKLEIGLVEALGITAMVMDHPTVEVFSSAFKKELGAPVDGIVGFPFFARYRMTVDYQAKEMTFVPNGYKPINLMESMTKALTDPNGVNAPKIVGPKGLWGFTVDEDSDDDEPGITIKEVTPNTPAAKAGLKAGDRLLTLDGRWTDSVADTHQASGFIKPGKTAVLVIKRGETELKLKVSPVNGL